MTHLIVLALATFLVWECLVRPAVTYLCGLLPVSGTVAAYAKSVTAVGTAVGLDRLVDERFLVPLSAASLAGTLHMFSRSREDKNIAAVSRGRARRGMPMPGP